MSRLSPLPGLGIEGLAHNGRNVTRNGGTPPLVRPMGNIERRGTPYSTYSEYTRLADYENSKPLENRSRSTYWKYFALSLLSVILSGLYLAVGIWGPVWYQIRDNNGILTPTFAKIVASIIDKIISLSFGSICVLFLGQILTRRAVSIRSEKGVNLLQISMRNWIIDPGSMIADAKVLPLGTSSWLGWFVLVAAGVSLLYGSATTALIQPTLRDAPAEHLNLTKTVHTKFANEWYLERNCRSPITNNASSQEMLRSCMSIVHSARGSYSFANFLGAWEDIQRSQKGSVEQSSRIVPRIPENGTWINAAWVNGINSKDESGRIINNVTLAIPQPGMIDAARHSAGSIPQPDEFEGLARYAIEATVPSPYLNVLCTTVSRPDLRGLVYQEPEVGGYNTTYMSYIKFLKGPFDWNSLDSVETPLRSIFQWDKRRKPPMFFKYPLDKQTLMNKTLDETPYNAYGQDTAYLLGSTSTNGTYFLCSMRAGLLPTCASTLFVAANSTSMTAQCGENDNGKKSSSNIGDTSGQTVPSEDWVAVASLAATSLSLSSGQMNEATDNQAMLTRLMPTKQAIDPLQPSAAEALSAILMPALVLAAQDMPLVDNWNIPENSTASGYQESIAVRLDTVRYISGGATIYKKLFLVVFVVVFLLNVMMFYHLFIHHHSNGLIIDICDPLNLFGVALQSSSGVASVPGSGGFRDILDGSQILSPRGTSHRLRPLSTGWRIRSAAGGRMVVEQTGPEAAKKGKVFGGNSSESLGGNGFTPLIDPPPRGRRGRHTGDDIEMA